MLLLSREGVNVWMVSSTALLLEGTCSLTELCLKECSIGENGACQLARAIRANSTLKKLDLTVNPLEQRGLKELVESLAHNSNIELVLPEKYFYIIKKVHKQIAWH